MEPKRSFHAIADAVEAVERARTLDEALDGFVRVFSVEHTLQSASVISLPDDGLPYVTGVRALSPPVVDKGWQIEPRLTEEMAVLHQLVLRGRPIAFRLADVDLGLMGEVLSADGVRSAIVTPLSRGGRVVAILVLTSATEDGFSARDVPLFTGIGKGVEDKLLRLTSLVTS